MSTHRQRDRGRDYNAFGRDPDGLIAFLAAEFFGPNYRPTYTPQRFNGTPEPPRYGPAAAYQLPYLPATFVPHESPFILFEGHPSEDPQDHCNPPEFFHPSLFAAVVGARRWVRRLAYVRRYRKQFTGYVSDEDEDGYETEPACE